MSWAKSLIEMKKQYKDPVWSGRIASNLKKMIIKKGFIMSENSLENAVTTLSTCGNSVVTGSKGGTLKIFEIKSDQVINFEKALDNVGLLKGAKMKEKELPYQHDFNPRGVSEAEELSVNF